MTLKTILSPILIIFIIFSLLLSKLSPLNIIKCCYAKILFTENNIKFIYDFIPYRYKNIKIVYLPYKEKAIWESDTQGIYQVKILRKSPSGYINTSDQHPDYYENVIKYYKCKLKKDTNKERSSVWYYLADAQLKANKPKDALNSISSGFKYLKNINGSLNPMLTELKGQALFKLGNPEKALQLFDEALSKNKKLKFNDNINLINIYCDIGNTLSLLNYKFIPENYYELALSIANNNLKKNSTIFKELIFKINSNLLKHKLKNNI